MRPSLPLLGAALQATVSAASSLTPPVLPLIVRNPYLSTWLGNARDEPWSKWPIFYTGEELGLSLMAQVPSTGTVYPLLGKPHETLPESTDYDFPTYLGARYDASTTNLTYSIDKDASTSANITVSFLSPITPTSTLRQSIPASYITVYIDSEVTVNIYMDINGQWVSNDPDSQIRWEFGSERSSLDTSPTLHKWSFERETPLLLSEIRDRAEWGTIHFTGPADAKYQSGAAPGVRRTFATRGSLTNVNDASFRSVGDREPVFAFSKSFVPARKSGVSDSVTFTIALIQDPVVQYASGRGLTMMRPLWKSWFNGVDSLLSFHYHDFNHAASLASNYSLQLAADAYQSGAQDYVDILALSARQVMGATTFSGTPEDPILFLKEISSNGNFQTIDVIFPAFPFFLYTNPRWLAYLLEPLIEHMLSGQYPNKYAMHDLGTHFPNATGHPDGKDEYMPLEECGNILIMGLAIVNSMLYEQDSAASSIWSTEGEVTPLSDENAGYFPLNEFQTLSGIDLQDGKWGGTASGRKQAEKWIERSYGLWTQWTSYLVEYALEPENQLSTDDFAGWLELQTNLALKGIIGIHAMSKIAEIGGHTADAAHYKNISESYIAKWEEFGMSRDNSHAKLSYNWYGSWTTIYNLYADAQLCFHLENTPLASTPYFSAQPGDGGQTPLQPNPKDEPGFVPHHVYTKQSNWYHAVRQKYGLPLDSRHLYTKTDWEFFAVAVASKPVRSEILESVAKWINETSTDLPFTDLHDTENDGGFPSPNFYARPVIGGHFAFLALQRACGGKAMDGLKFLDEELDGFESSFGDGEVVREDL